MVKRCSGFQVVFFKQPYGKGCSRQPFFLLMKLKYTILFFVSALGLVSVSYIFLELLKKNEDLFLQSIAAIFGLAFFITVIWIYVRAHNDQKN